MVMSMKESGLFDFARRTANEVKIEGSKVVKLTNPRMFRKFQEFLGELNCNATQVEYGVKVEQRPFKKPKDQA